MKQDELGLLPPAAAVVPAARAPHRLRRAILYASATLLAIALSAAPFHIERDTLLPGMFSAMAKDGGTAAMVAATGTAMGMATATATGTATGEAMATPTAIAAAAGDDGDASNTGGGAVVAAKAAAQSKSTVVVEFATRPSGRSLRRKPGQESA
jgi:hypothetical protein